MGWLLSTGVLLIAGFAYFGLAIVYYFGTLWFGWWHFNAPRIFVYSRYGVRSYALVTWETEHGMEWKKESNTPGKIAFSIKKGWGAPHTIEWDKNDVFVDKYEGEGKVLVTAGIKYRYLNFQRDLKVKQDILDDALEELEGYKNKNAEAEAEQAEKIEKMTAYAERIAKSAQPAFIKKDTKPGMRR